MPTAINILLEAAGKHGVVVDKASHVVWDHHELVAAAKAGCYPDDDRLAAPTGQVAVSGPFPGCLQQFGAPADLARYVLVGQTEHFLIFAPPPSSDLEHFRTPLCG